MAEFRGFQCDDCGEIIAEGNRTKYTERFEGKVSGERRQDLCPTCIQKRLPDDGSDLRPLRRRRKSSDSTSS